MIGAAIKLHALRGVCAGARVAGAAKSYFFYIFLIFIGWRRKMCGAAGSGSQWVHGLLPRWHETMPRWNETMPRWNEIVATTVPVSGVCNGPCKGLGNYTNRDYSSAFRHLQRA